MWTHACFFNTLFFKKDKIKCNAIIVSMIEYTNMFVLIFKCFLESIKNTLQGDKVSYLTSNQIFKNFSHLLWTSYLTLLTNTVYTTHVGVTGTGNEIDEEYFLYSTSYTLSLKGQGTEQIQNFDFWPIKHKSVDDKFYSSTTPSFHLWFCPSYISFI